MRISSIVALLLGSMGAIALSAAFSSAHGEGAPEEAGVTWHRDLSVATELAATQRRPLCVVFR